MFLLCVVAQWSQAQISGSASTYEWLKGDNMMKTSAEWSYSVTKLTDIEMNKDTCIRAGSDYNGYIVIIRNYHAKVKSGENVTVTLRCDGISGDEAVCDEVSLWVGTLGSYRVYLRRDSDQEFKGERKKEKRGPATLTCSFNVKCSESANDAHFRIEMKGEMDSSHGTGPFGQVVKPDGVGWLEVRIDVDVINSEQPHESETAVIPTDTTVIIADTDNHVIEDTDAWTFDGVWPIAIPASVIAALAGFLISRRKKPTSSQGDKQQQQPEDNSPCELHIYKGFGDTLLVGNAPQQVFAKIVRKTSQGERTDPALTQMIQITSGDGYVEVHDGGMHGEWRTAWVSAPETGSPPPAEGIVTFRMGNEDGSYTNRVHFRIEAGEVIFGQDNLTLPAHYQKEVRLPFLVTGLEGNAEVTAKITDGSGQKTANYSVRVEWNAKEQLHYAVIHDCVLDPAQDKGVPGHFLCYALEVEAKSPAGQIINGRLELYRYYMGLILDVGDIQCYIEEFSPLNHRTDKFASVRNGKKYVPSETRAKLTLFDYDEAQNRILQIAPIPTEFIIRTNDADSQYLADNIAVKMEVTDCRPGDATCCRLRCTKAVLDAPNRVAATVTISVMNGEKKVTATQNIRLSSQPIRQFASNDAMAAALKNDERLTGQLERIRSEIYRHRLVDNLFPLVKYIDTMLDSYDPDYGYDPKALHTIVQTYNDVYSGEKAGAMEDLPEPLTLADDVKEFVKSWYETTKTTSRDLGFCGRLFVGFATLGCSEVVFGTVDTISVGEEIYTGMKNYVDQGGNSVWEGFVVGAKVATREYLMSKAMRAGLKVAGAGLKVAGAGLKKAGLSREGMAKLFNKVNRKTDKPYSTRAKGAPVKAAAKNSQFRQANAKVQAKAQAANVKPAQPVTPGATGKSGASSFSGKANMNEAARLAKARANQNVNDLRAACEMYRANPTPTNKIMRDKLIMKCQSDKHSMYLLKEKGDAFTSTRKDFNGHLNEIYKSTDIQVGKELSQQLGGKKVRTKSISSKQPTDLKEGRTVTMDRDTTYEYLDTDGVWKTIDDKTFGDGTEKMVEQTYNRHFHELATGIKPKTEAGVDLKPLEQKLADKYGKKMDQTIVQNELTHRESYGRDVNMMMNKNRHGERMQDARQVGKAVENKGTERFDDARKMLNEADSMTDPNAKLNKQADAIGEIREGCRQEVKIMDQFTDSMDIARAGENGGSRISDKLRDAIEIMRMCSEGTLPVDQAEANLRLIGYDSFEAVCRDHAATITAIGS